MVELKSIQKAKKITKVGSFGEIRECQTTGIKSLHATAELRTGDVISKFGSLEVRNRPNYLTVQIGEGEHIMLDPEYLQYINHSCDPNVVFDTKKGVVMAIKKIARGEEFTFFYPSTEWSMDRGFDCLCGSEDCLGYIQGAAHLPLKVLTKYQLSQYIQQKLEIKRARAKNK
jgi:hypothetical protein